MLIQATLTSTSSIRQLHCSLGDFYIDDDRFNHLSDGSQSGFFELIGFVPHCYQNTSSFVLEILAKIGRFALLPSDTKFPDSLIVESVVHQANLLPDVNTEIQNDSEIQDAILFGKLWPLAKSIKLDPNQDRSLFDKQRLRLKALNFNFDPKSQTWFKSS